MLKLIKKYLRRGQDRWVLAALQTTTTTFPEREEKKRENVETKGQEKRRQWKITIPHGFCGPETKKSESSRWASVFFSLAFSSSFAVSRLVTCR